MKVKGIKGWWIWAVGVCLLWLITPHLANPAATPAYAQKPQLSQSQLLAELEKVTVIYLGEEHDNPLTHQAQLEIITALAEKNPRLAIALEMFQRPFQPAINAYLGGEISEAELIELSEYEQRWGYPWEYYAPILRFAKEQQLPVLALNTPTEVTFKVARQGLASLTGQDLRYIPPLTEIDTSNSAYRRILEEVYQLHPHASEEGDGFERFFAAQVLWDETMAEKIAQFHQANPEYQIVVLAGEGHIMYGYGIPSRVARRVTTPEFEQLTIFFGSPEEDLLREQADYFWLY